MEMVVAYASKLIQQFAHQSVFSVQMKNCEPFVFCPLFAIESVPATQLYTTLLKTRVVKTARFF